MIVPDVNDEAGNIEATEVPKYTGPADQYVPDPNYDPANDLIDPETRGEDMMPGTPGAVGDPFIFQHAITPTEIKES